MFVGRAEETRRIAAALGEGARIVTLWGPGGAGKTTLARRVEHAIWVDLASARTAEDLVTAFATALGVEAEESAVVHAVEIRGQRIVADNVEQVGAEGRAALVRIAKAAPLVVTSRDALGAEGEVAIEIAPLPAEDAIALYTQLSGLNADDDARAIVSRLDALPLAIELAAARAPLLGSTALRARLEKSFDVLKDKDRVARHATLDAAIAWSWELLDETERNALVVCAQFEAPFDAALAEAAIGGDALDALDTLRKRALLRVEAEHRWRLFESVRAFARGDRVHEGYARAVLERVEPLALAVRRGEVVDPELARRRGDLQALGANPRLAPELRARALLALAALRAITGPHDFEGAVDGLEGELALRLLVAKGVAARAAGRLDDAESAPTSAIEAAPDDAHALRLAGMVARARGDSARAVALLERALAAYRAAGEEAFAGLTLGELGAAQQSAARLAEGIAILVATKSVRAEGLLRSHLAVLTHRRGDPRAAIPLHEAALAIHRCVGNRRLEGAELLHLGFVRHEMADVEAARASLDEARRTLGEAGALGLEALACAFRARLEVDAGNLVSGRIALAEAARIAPPGWHRLRATCFVVQGHLGLAEGDRSAAAALYEQALATSRDVEVGFEALTPAYRAFATGAPAPSMPAFANPHLAHAWAVLTGAASNAPAEAIAASSDVRRAIAFAGKRALIITANSFILPDGRSVDLSKRKNIRLVLAALTASKDRAQWTTPDALIAAGWPGERMRSDAATKRLHTAIWTLRKLGLEGILQSGETGYRLDPDIHMELRIDNT
jgi:predicted ATPase